ncbi:GIY-YIG nuclease family protein [Pedobacter fastidiosus]|uniref:GIY-YIG nuclease family protein n=1 Tax=Pedobacter fastidiosus TaxID=2765361 RepID=A0ABR7KRR7_9SPHI|nr:GIY-YIG nuclease family protein [Pedobacter fastidiosus]MBC6110762.1 GIY-YIG nuclease family protein [Pedobacter fastidiosus]
MFLVYILQSSKNGRFYIGHTEDLIKRILRHNSGQVVATKNKGPWEVVYKEIYSIRSEAVRRELEIKSKKSRKYIETLINTQKY